MFSARKFQADARTLGMSSEDANRIRKLWDRSSLTADPDMFRDMCVIVEHCDEKDALILSQSFMREIEMPENWFYYNRSSRVLYLCAGAGGVSNSVNQLVISALVSGYFLGKRSK